MKRFVFVLVASMVICSACSKKESSQPVVKVAQEKAPAPEITVTSVSTAVPVKLSELKGKVVLLNFWATWCPPCREEIPSMMKLNASMNGKPFQMVAVSIDEGGKAAIEEFFRSSGYSLPAYLDLSGSAAKLYGITGVPESFIIDKQGVIVKKVVGGLAWDSAEVASFLERLMK